MIVDIWLEFKLLQLGLEPPCDKFKNGPHYFQLITVEQFTGFLHHKINNITVVFLEFSLVREGYILIIIVLEKLFS